MKDDFEERDRTLFRSCMFTLLTLAAIVLVIVLAWKFLLDYVRT